jgi:hypothetical protein
MCPAMNSSLRDTKNLEVFWSIDSTSLSTCDEARQEKWWAPGLYFYSLFFSSLCFFETLAKGMDGGLAWEMQLEDMGSPVPNSAFPTQWTHHRSPYRGRRPFSLTPSTSLAPSPLSLPSLTLKFIQLHGPGQCHWAPTMEVVTQNT